MRFFVFISVILTVLLLGSFYIGNFASRSGWFDQHRRALWLCLALFVIVQISGPLLYRVLPDHGHRFFIFHWLTYMSLGLFACLFFYVVFADVIQFVMSRLFDHSVDPERRNFILVSGLTLGSMGAGVAQALAGPKLYEVEIPLANLPPEFDGFKIVQITDLHVGPLIGRKYVENVVKMANDLKPDMFALTGDFIDGEVEYLRDAVQPIADLKAPHGSFFITGNHEYYWDADAWLEQMRKFGARTLINEHVILKSGESSIVLGGVTDYRAQSIKPEHASDPIKAFAGAPAGAVKVLLAHQPASYLDAEKAGAHLQISGHTHGGQFFPWSVVVKLAQRYYKGLDRYKDMWIYVSRGTGYWGPPVRFTVPAEITLLKLIRPRD